MPRQPRDVQSAAKIPDLFTALEPRVLLAADPITTDHPLWTIGTGSAVIDGQLNDAAWDSAFAIDRTLPYRDTTRATVRFMHDVFGLYVSAEARDQWIWADGNGGGTGNRWDLEQDDSFTIYVDADNSREEFFGPNDRSFGVNLGANGGPLTGSGVVSRFKFVYGTSDGGGFDVRGGGALPDFVAYATSINGTPNDNTDLDVGWAIEMFIPWAALNTTAPTHGSTMAMNFDLIFDDSGGTRDISNKRSGPDRFTEYNVIDDHVLGVHSSYAGTLAGVHGPISYAEVMFVNSAAGQRPATIDTLAAVRPSPFGGRLAFIAPAGTTGGAGHVSSYQIRYSNEPITTEADWESATVFENAYVPRLAGKIESLRIIGLEPSQSYHIAVRAADAAGVIGDIASAQLTTQALPEAGYPGRIVPSPMGGYLVFENGDPHFVVGDHLGHSWAFTRNLYPGDVYTGIPSTPYINFNDAPSYEGVAEPYFQLLQQRGINTMRVYLELLGLDQDGNDQWPRGGYWTEYPRGTFNTDQRDYMHNILEMADRYDIHIIFSPYDTYSLDEVFDSQTALYTGAGGPLSTINDYFQTPATLDMAKARATMMVAWANQSEHADRIIGWEPLSEWDSWEWTLNAEGDGWGGREPEMRTRAIWISELAHHFRTVDPDRLVLSSTISRDPRGPVAREVFYSRAYDAHTSHIYTNGNSEPVNNPASDRSILAAREQATLTAFWISNITTNAPLLNGEWGPSRLDWGGEVGYSTQYTQAEDEDMFRSVLWAGIAAGQFGTPLRINTEELAPNGYLLTDPDYPITSPVSMFNLPGQMRPIQYTIGQIMADTGIDLGYATFNGTPLNGLISVSADGHDFGAWGTSDSIRGLAYILRDFNVSSGTVSGATFSLEGLRRDSFFDLEFWVPDVGATAPVFTLNAVYTPDGRLSVTLPDFADDLVVKFKARDDSFVAQPVASLGAGGAIITFALRSDGRPIAFIDSGAGVPPLEVDIAALTGFSGRLRDITVFVTPDGLPNMAATDDRHHLWLFQGSSTLVSWTAIDLTAQIDAPGVTGHLTTYQPSWGSIHLAGLDARGHAINYWWSPGMPDWVHTDLTVQFEGPIMTGGLTGFVAPWDGLNLAGLNAESEVIAYWWAPGMTTWDIINMTETFDGPRLYGQLDAFVLPWGAMNIAGLDENGDVATYWWAPGFQEDPYRWRVENLSRTVGSDALETGVEVGVSLDGGINIFGLDDTGGVRLLRWSVAAPVWIEVDVRARTSGVGVDFPFAAGAIGNRLTLSARSAETDRALTFFGYDTLLDRWDLRQDPMIISI